MCARVLAGLNAAPEGRLRATAVPRHATMGKGLGGSKSKEDAPPPAAKLASTKADTVFFEAPATATEPAEKVGPTPLQRLNLIVRCSTAIALASART